jgi:FMN phosphatase YigB (HAD superfamily)
MPSAAAGNYNRARVKISAVCFDLGKVLLDFDWTEMLACVARKSPLTPDEIRQRIFTDNEVLGYERGAITTAKFFSHLKKRLEYKGPAKELRTAFNGIFTPLTENIALAALLAPHYPLAIISNTNDAHITHAESAYSFFTLFPARIYSHQVGAMKPQREIYDRAREAVGHPDPTEILFIDDLEANILGAVQLGWQTIHLRPDVNLRQALASYELRGLDL